MQNLEQLLIEKEAILKGHFQLSSGLHSDTYIQTARLLQYPPLAEMIGEMLGMKFKEVMPEVVIGPALGGVVLSFVVARFLGVRSIFAERKEGKLQIRRGFEIKRGEKVLVVEDVVTTALSVKETIELVKSYEGQVVGVGCIVDRSKTAIGLPNFQPLLRLDIKTYQPENCPFCQQEVPFYYPGSRKG